MLLLALLAVAAPNPVTSESSLSEDRQWEILAACPRVVTRTGSRGVATGVVVGTQAGYVYVLTAQHATPGPDEREVQFFTKASYPKPELTLRGVEVLQRWQDPDLSLMRVKLGPERVPILPLAGVGERPTKFPADALSVGCSHGEPPTCRPEVIVGRRAARRPGGGLAFFWELGSSPVPGRSGGPLLDSAGRVIGICAAGRNGKGYYTHLDEIQVALQSADFGWLWRAGSDPR